MKKLAFSAMLTLPVLIFVYMFMNSSTNLILLLDIIFYIGLILLVIGSVLLIIHGGFFNAFISTTKHFFSTISKKEQAVKLFSGEKSSKASYKKEYPASKHILLIGGFYFLFGVIASIVVVSI